MINPPSDAWAVTTLEHVVDILDAKRVPVKKSERDKRPGNVPYYGATGLAGWIDKPIFNEELLLLGEDGAPFLDPIKPKSYIIQGPAWVNNHAHVLRAIDGLASNEFLKYQLDWTPYAGHVTGTTRLKLTQRAMRQLPILLPGIAAQKRIVTAIEEHLSRLDAVDSALEMAKLRSAQLLECALQAGIRQYSTQESSLASFLTQKLSNGRSVPTANGDGFPVLRLTCLQGGLVNASETKLGDFSGVDHEKYRIEPDDFLISRGNGSIRLVGIGGLVPAHAPPVAFPDTLIRARVDRRRLRPEFLRLIWNSKTVRRQLESQARTTAGIYKVNQTMIGKVSFPTPSLEDQDRLVQEMDQVREVVAGLNAGVSLAQERSKSLRRSILADAFSGRLVPQDPNDEPASVLLDRISGARRTRSTKRGVVV